MAWQKRGFSLRVNKLFSWNVKGAEDGLQHSDLLGFWTLSIVWNCKH
jgi:hypothetical protein